MAELLPALAISGTILVIVVSFTIFVTIAAVRRGEVAMLGGVHDIHHGHAVPVTAAGPAVTAKAVAAAPEEISVATILVLGLVLFGLAMAGLMAVSILGHLM